MKSTFIAILILFVSKLSVGQNLYLTASTGYNFGSDRANFENYTANKLISVFYPSDVDRDYYSLGKGVNMNIGIGYTTKRRIGFELEASYLVGLKTTAKSEYIADDVFQKEIWGRFYRISPSVHLVNEFDHFSVKIHMGGLVGFGKMYLNQKAVYKGDTWFDYNNEFTGGYYLGIRAGIGVVIPISKRLNISFDVEWIHAYFSPDKSEVTKFMNGPYDDLDKISVWERETIYSKSVEKAPYNPDIPSQRLRGNFAASSIGLQVGIQWNLWKKKVKESE